MRALIIDATTVSLPNGLVKDQTFTHYQSEIIELLQSDTEIINYFGLVPDNGADGIANAFYNGVLFRFDVLQTILRIDLDAEPRLVRSKLL